MVYPVARSIRNTQLSKEKIMTSLNSSRVKAPAFPAPQPSLVSLETDELSSPNSPEREDCDRIEFGTKNHKPKLLVCKRPSIFSTLNARSLSLLSRKQELLSCFSKYNVDVLSLQEHRIFHQDVEFKHINLGKNKLVTTSAWKNTQGTTVGGIGILLSSRASDNLLSLTKVSKRIVVAEFNSSPKTTFISCYSPTNVSDEAAVDDFYSSLSRVVLNTPAHNFLIISGDFNAQIGLDNVKFSFHPSTNRNGHKLFDFMQQFQLLATNTIFMKKASKLWTFQHPSGSKSQIDYVLVRGKWRNSVRNAQSYSSFSSVGSDHRVVSCHIYLSLRSSKKPKPDPMKSIDWHQVYCNSDLRSRYIFEVKNRFDLLSQPGDDLDDLEKKYQTLIEANKQVSLSLLPKKQKAKKKHLFENDLLSEARKALVDAKLKHQRRPTRRTSKYLSNAQKRLDDAYLNAEAMFIQGKINSISNLHVSHQHSAAWKVINELSGRKDHPSIQLKGGSPEKRREHWLKHFKSLLGNLPVLNTEALPLKQIFDELVISTSPFTKDELIKCVKLFSNNKSSGLDNIPTVLWKDPIFLDLLLEFCNHTFENFSPPSAWLTGGIIPVPKKGDLTLASNYRGITLMPIAAKIYNKLILRRIVPVLDPLLRKNQNGFRRGRNTLSQILAIRRILEEMRKLNKDAFICFVDFKKAFDSISREKMFEILKLYGIPGKIISAIRALYVSTKAKVISTDGDSDIFDIHAGVLQGDTLAPFLFILVLDYVLRISVDFSNDKGIKIKAPLRKRNQGLYITDLDFADDLALVAETIQNLEDLLHSLETSASQVGLYCNEGKTEFISSSGNILPLISLNGVNIKLVKDFKYLGSHINSSEDDFKIRKGLAWKACNKLNKIWHSNLSNTLKLHTFKSLVEPILLYGSETWTMTKAMLKSLDGCYTNLLKRVLNLDWRNHPTLQEIYNGLPRISSVLTSRMLTFSGHCFRSKHEVISDLLLWCPAGPKRSRKRTFLDVLKRETGLESEELRTAMANRELWREGYCFFPT